MSHYTDRPLPHSSALATFLAKRLDELKGDTTLREIAIKLGYSQGNIISMFKSGECKIPLEKVPALADALDVDVAHLMRLGLEQYWPDKMNVITDVFSRMVTANEMALLVEVRKLTSHADPQLTLTNNGRAMPHEIAGVALKVERVAMTKKGPVVQEEFYVKLMRPVFQIAVVAIKAETAKEAASIALEQARDLEETKWSGRFDPKHYAYDVQDVIDPLEEHGESPTAKRRRLQNQLSATPAAGIRYLLLKADVDSGEGSVLMPPWLEAHGELMVSDLAGDWLQPIEIIEEHGLSSYYDVLRQLGAADDIIEREGEAIPVRRRPSDRETDPEK